MLNKILKKQDVKIGLEHKFFIFKIAIVVFLIFLLTVPVAISRVWGQDSSTNRLTTPNGTIPIEIADSAHERYSGLSGRLSVDGGMLFVYDYDSFDHCLVMRDMLFSIDMVWMDSDKKVISLQKNVSPDTYPEVFCPGSSARYALELTANNAEALGIVVGSVLMF